MWTEVILSACHIILLMAWVTFLAAQTALCRVQWLNAAVLARLLRLSYLSVACAGLVLLSGLARLFLGVKPWAFYAPLWTLHLKLTLFAVVFAMSLYPIKHYRQWLHAWQSSLTLPTANALKRVRVVLMVQTHLFIIMPILAALMARGM